MSAAHETLKVISEDLMRGSARMALLGSSSDAELRLDSPESLARYADRMRPQIAAALKADQSTMWFIYVLLTALFAAAITLTVLANIKGWGWATSAGAIPGLGITAIWPIRTLIRLRRENLQLSLVPELLPLLPPKDSARIIKRILDAG
jgi:hypothetical protein